MLKNVPGVFAKSAHCKSEKLVFFLIKKLGLRCKHYMKNKVPFPETRNLKKKKKKLHMNRICVIVSAFSRRGLFSNKSA